jgi:hypothetical protein
MSTLLKSAIADAKAIRQTALENARVALSEAFAPRLQSMLSKKISEEAASEDGYTGVKEAYTTVDKDTDKAQINLSEEDELPEIPGEEEDPLAVSAPEIDPNAVELDVDATPGQEVDVVPTGTGKVELEPSQDPNAVGSPEIPGEEGQDDSQGLDLESIIAELEAEAGAEESPEEPTFGDDDSSEDPSVNVTAVQAPDDVTVDFSDETGDEDTTNAGAVPTEDGDEEVNLEEILRELEQEGTLDETLTTDQPLKSHTEQPQKGNMGSDKTGINKTPSLGGDKSTSPDKAATDAKYGTVGKSAGDNFEDFGKTTKALEENKKLRKSLSEHIKAVVYLKGKINEINLLNSKLLFTNKLFKNFPLTNEQKVKVVESLDLTKSVREVKLVYTTLAESFSFGSNRTMKKPVSSHKVITEGLASKVTASTKPTKEILSESADMANRFQKLAGIKVNVKK